MYRSNSNSFTLLIATIAAFIIGWTMGSSYSLQPRSDMPTRPTMTR